MSKDNLFANRTLWLDAEHMNIARDRQWHAFTQASGGRLYGAVDKHMWDVAFAAAIAAYSFCAEGNLGQPVESGEA
jgi:hypothetical protein